MRIVLNGEAHELESDLTVSDLVHRLTDRENPPGLAVAVNGEVVLRSAWKATTMAEGDRVEVLGAVAGG